MQIGSRKRLNDMHGKESFSKQSDRQNEVAEPLSIVYRALAELRRPASTIDTRDNFHR